MLTELLVSWMQEWQFVGWTLSCWRMFSMWKKFVLPESCAGSVEINRKWSCTFGQRTKGNTWLVFKSVNLVISGDRSNVWPDTETEPFPDPVLSLVLSYSCTFQTQPVNQSLPCKSTLNSEARDVYLYENVQVISSPLHRHVHFVRSATPRFTSLFIRVSMWRKEPRLHQHTHTHVFLYHHPYGDQRLPGLPASSAWTFRPGFKVKIRIRLGLDTYIWWVKVGNWEIHFVKCVCVKDSCFTALWGLIYLVSLWGHNAVFLIYMCIYV